MLLISNKEWVTEEDVLRFLNSTRHRGQFTLFEATTESPTNISIISVLERDHDR